MKCERDLELASLHQAIDVPMKSGAKTRFVEQRRMQEVRGLSDLLEDCAHRGTQVLVAAARVDIHFDGGDVLCEIVVELSGDPATLFILDLQQCRREFL